MASVTDMHVFLIADITRQGLTIAVAGMVIVGLALAFISLFIAALPQVLAAMGRLFPEQDDAHARRGHHERLEPHDEALYAAIGYALHMKHQEQLASKER
ncbi:OadG family protein [Novipirellula artificiosorum]|uniref:Oxaloacetate decarboxylase, gamma chain n=1 Tax=Novipirellula artificiosorum TaxID=2528016 RepID=A0A5C6E5V6_9BACT|nr:OadG family protein [Novipirellula artificiosorum]TWU42509.1 Oxaloacetate decarboxylase, gamma chain [Novipirellula artificiosorum]